MDLSCRTNVLQEEVSISVSKLGSVNKLGRGRNARMREQTHAEDEHPGAKSERSFEASEAGARSGIPRWSGNAGIKLEAGCFKTY